MCRNKVLEQVPYIAKHSVANALAWEARLRAAMNAVGDFRGHAVDEDASQRLGGTIHKTVFERTYVIHYRVDDAGTTVEIVNLRHGARQPRRGEP